jgi:hypothetical protein
VRRAALAGAAIAAALAGCGGGDDRGAVRSTVQGYIDAFVKGDGATTCSLMTAKTREEFVKATRPLSNTDDCAQATGAVRVAAGDKAVEAMRHAKLSDVKVHGDSATVKLTARGGQSVATLTKQDGDWKVSSAPGAP